MTKRIVAVLGSMTLVAVAAWIIMMRPGSVVAANPDWLTDMQKAREIAAKEKKDLLINFTGSDWCSWCVKLQKEVFNEKAFEKALDDFVLVEMDFPQDKSIVPPKTREQNEEWSNRFGIEGFPTIMLTDSEGRPYGSLGYVQGGPPAFLGELDKIQKVRETRDEQLAKAKQAEGLEKAKHLASALEAIPAEYHLPMYRSEVDQIIALDPQDQAGLKSRFTKVVQQAEAEKRLQELQQELQVAFTKQGPDAALKIIQEALKDKKSQENPVLQTALKQFEIQLLIKKAEVLVSEKKSEEADEVFKTALKKTEKGTDEWLMVQVNRADLLKQVDKSKEAASVYDEMLTVKELAPIQQAMILVYAAEAHEAAKQDTERVARIEKADKIIQGLGEDQRIPPQIMEQLHERLDAVRNDGKSAEQPKEKVSEPNGKPQKDAAKKE